MAEDELHIPRTNPILRQAIFGESLIQICMHAYRCMADISTAIGTHVELLYVVGDAIFLTAKHQSNYDPGQAWYLYGCLQFLVRTRKEGGKLL